MVSNASATLDTLVMVLNVPMLMNVPSISMIVVQMLFVITMSVGTLVNVNPASSNLESCELSETV